MHRRLSLAALGAVLAISTAAAAQDAATLEHDVRVLAADNMEGREAGTRGHERAVGYVAGRMATLGLAGGGDNGTYFQTVPLLRYERLPDGNALAIDGLDGLVLGTDYTLSGTAEAPSGTLEAELVFVGYGLDLPGRDDLAGVDLTGKIAVRTYGGPRMVNSEEAAHNRSGIADRVAARGAVGLLLLWTPLLEEARTWERSAKGSASAMTWARPDGSGYSSAPGLQVTGSLSAATARTLLAGQAFDYDDLIAAERTPEALVPAFPLGRTARISYASSFTRIDSPNVIGLLPGSDPALADQFVVLTAHLDHVGITQTETEGDDEIYNGAMDNAVGVASLLEVARLLHDHRPRRPVLFVALTAEEKGLLGSSYHAANPGLASGRLVANVNLDMPIVAYDFRDVVAYGAERSNLYPAVQAAAAALDLTFSPDPSPEQGFFVRSDQYSYVLRGIPAVNLDLGWANGGQAAQENFLSQYYHQVGDEADKVDWAALLRFTALNYAVARNVADMALTPAWNPGDYFGERYGPTAAIE